MRMPELSGKEFSKFKDLILRGPLARQAFDLLRQVWAKNSSLLNEIVEMLRRIEECMKQLVMACGNDATKTTHFLSPKSSR